MIVRCREDAQVVGRSDSSAVFRHRVPNRSAVPCDGSFLHIVACLCPDEEAFVAESGVEVCGGPFEQVEEGAGVEVGLFEVEVQFCAVVLRGGEVVGQDFGF